MDEIYIPIFFIKIKPSLVEMTLSPHNAALMVQVPALFLAN